VSRERAAGETTVRSDEFKIFYPERTVSFPRPARSIGGRI
jgi:hypothetical protein